jgi:hydrogenase maturation protease
VPRVVVAGYGNTLRRDDGVGWRVAAALAERRSDGVTVLLGQQPLPEWAETLAVTEVAYFVDASLTASDRPRLRRLTPVPDASLLDGHGLRPAHLLWLADRLYGRAPASYLLALPAVDLGFGEALSPRAARAAGRAIRLLERRLVGPV